MGSAKPAGIHASAARNGYLQGSDKAEAAPPGPSRPPYPQGTKTVGSHQSSLTSLEGSGISEHLPQKSLRQAGGLPPEVSMSMRRGSPRDFCPRAFAHTLPACLLFRSLPVTVLPNIQGLCPVTSRTPAPLPGTLACPPRAWSPLYFSESAEHRSGGVLDSMAYW